MDWSSIAQLIAPLAPKLGSLLGAGFGPIGGIIGSIAGNAIAGALGVAPTPAAVSNAIATDPDAAAKIAKLEAEHADALIQQAQVEITRAQEQGLTDRANITAVNATIQGENLGNVPWWHWRHLLGYVPVMLGIETAALVPMMVFGKLDATAATAMMGAITPPLTIFSGLLGYVAQDTTRQKIVAATGSVAPTVTDTALTAVKNMVNKVRGK